jgi:signal peptidase II
MKNRLGWIALPLAIFALDFSSKAWVLRNFTEHQVLPVIPGFFNLMLGFNSGAIFGSLQGVSSPFRTILFTIAGAGALGYFGWEFLREDSTRRQRIALGLILGGILGNGMDRLQHGAVVDFLDFYVKDLNLGFTKIHEWHYWTFNVADSAIVCGAILLGFTLMKAHKATAPAER